MVLVLVLLVVVILALVSVLAVGKVQGKVLVLVSLLVWVLLSVVGIGFGIGIGNWVRVHTRKCSMVQRGGRERERETGFLYMACLALAYCNGGKVCLIHLQKCYVC